MLLQAATLRSVLHFHYSINETKLPATPNDSKALPPNHTESELVLLSTFPAAFHLKNASTSLQPSTPIHLDAPAQRHASILGYGFFCNLSYVCNLFSGPLGPHFVKHQTCSLVTGGCCAGKRGTHYRIASGTNRLLFSKGAIRDEALSPGRFSWRAKPGCTLPRRRRQAAARKRRRRSESR